MSSVSNNTTVSSSTASGGGGGGNGGNVVTFDQDTIKSRFPLHYYVWHDDKESLKRYLKQCTSHLHSHSAQPRALEQKDPRGRTPLMLAVTLGHKKCARILLNHNANVNVTDATGFNVLHEAVTSTDPEFISDVYEQKEVQRYTSRVDGIPNLLSKIWHTADFYLEMKWEFTSWVPLVTRLCPSDTYKIYKRGSKVRVDTTLVGMDTNSGQGIAGTPTWQRGNRSFIFIGSENGATLLEVDHVERKVHKRTMKVITQEEILEFLQPTEEQIAERLTNAISTTFIDTEKIQFERAKSGFIGFRSDRTETINGFECKVYSANNVELVTKTRVEHLTSSDKERLKAVDNSRFESVKSILGITQVVVPNPFENVELEDKWRRNPYRLTLEEYFNSSQPTTTTTMTTDQQQQNSTTTDASTISSGVTPDIGIPRELTIRTQHFKANLWLSEEFPLSLPEQVLPIVDLMAISSSHFAKLRDFIAAHLPVGFPVKIEIPLFHLLNARVTFGNIFAMNEPVKNVSTNPLPSDGIINTDGSKTSGNAQSRASSASVSGVFSCTVDESCFEPPSDYQVIGENDESGNSLDGFVLGHGSLENGGVEGGGGGGSGAQQYEDEDYFQYSDALEQYFGTVNRLAATTTTTTPTAGNANSGTGGGQQTAAATATTATDQITFLEALKTEPPLDMDPDMQRAIQISLMEFQQQQQQQQKMTTTTSEQDKNTIINGHDDVTMISPPPQPQPQQQQQQQSSFDDDDDTFEDAQENVISQPTKLSLIDTTTHSEETRQQTATTTTTTKQQNSPTDEQLRRTLEQSRLDHELELRRRKQEEDELAKVLQLSLTDK